MGINLGGIWSGFACKAFGEGRKIENFLNVYHGQSLGGWMRQKAPKSHPRDTLISLLNPPYWSFSPLSKIPSNYLFR